MEQLLQVNLVSLSYHSSAMEGGGDNSNMILAKAHIPLYFHFLLLLEYHGLEWMDSSIPLQRKILSPIIKVYHLICKFAFKEK